MTQKFVKAQINWVPTEQGGKKKFPSTIGEYYTIAYFYVDGVLDKSAGRSVVIRMISNNKRYESICYLNFLFPEIPQNQNLLFEGNKFVLWELNKTADVIIIET